MRRQSNANWSVDVVAPWCLGVGLLVSFTASAGQDTANGWNEAPLTARGARGATATSLAAALSGEPGHNQLRPLIQLSRLTDGGPLDLHTLPDEREPHNELKPNATHFPEIDRSRKGDPVVAIRPTFETRLTGAVSPDLAFSISGTSTQVALQPRSALPGEEESADSGNPQESLRTTTQKGAAAALPAQAASVSTPASVEALKERAAHGATPQVARAAALGSSTPAQPDAVPIEAASFPRATLALQNSSPSKESIRPDYASMIDQDRMSSEKRCLAEAVYFEARSEPEAGQAAVAQVVLNRVSSGLYPTNICGVVYQNRHHYKGCQFSFACEGKSLRITERESWTSAVRIADEVLAGRTYISDVGRSTHYHANYVKPRWARSLTKMDVIGHHIFYRLKPGQT
jgi:spore germination cell wall hydrolase CwlJ-like protein